MKPECSTQNIQVVLLLFWDKAKQLPPAKAWPPHLPPLPPGPYWGLLASLTMGCLLLTAACHQHKAISPPITPFKLSVPHKEARDHDHLHFALGSCCLPNFIFSTKQRHDNKHIVVVSHCKGSNEEEEWLLICMALGLRSLLVDMLLWAHSQPPCHFGALLTAGVLTVGLISFRQGNSQLGQKLMRARVLVQGATVALMVGSAAYYGEQIKWFKKNKE